MALTPPVAPVRVPCRWIGASVDEAEQLLLEESPESLTLRSWATDLGRSTIRWSTPVFEFFLHLVAGTVLFCGIGLAALAVNRFNAWFDSFSTGDSTKAVGTILYLVEVVLVLCDAFLFICYVALTGWMMLRNLWHLSQADQANNS